MALKVQLIAEPQLVFLWARVYLWNKRKKVVQPKGMWTTRKFVGPSWKRCDVCVSCSGTKIVDQSLKFFVFPLVERVSTIFASNETENERKAFCKQCFIFFFKIIVIMDGFSLESHSRPWSLHCIMTTPFLLGFLFSDFLVCRSGFSKDFLFQLILS